jgi:hypothetical protein
MSEQAKREEQYATYQRALASEVAAAEKLDVWNQQQRADFEATIAAEGF